MRTVPRLVRPEWLFERCSRVADDYILGVDSVEIERLRSQHEIWSEQMRALLKLGGVREGMRALDLGCGPGATSLELARHVGATGSVIACDESRAFIEILRESARAEGLANLEPRVTRLEELELEAASLDVVYGRWILSWLPDVEGVFTTIAKALRPGGVYLLQEYLDWGAMKILPGAEWFDSGVRACMESWLRGGGRIDIALHVSEIAVRHGLRVESFEIQARSGKPGSPVWRWMDEFYESYLVRLVEQGHYAREEQATFAKGWKQAGTRPETVVVAPVVADFVLRKPEA